MTYKTMTKTIRKNKTKLAVNWPASHFTIDELNKLNSDFINITLRVRLKTALDEKKVVELGTLNVGKGRPKLVFAVAPVSETTLQSARDNNVLLHDSYNSVVVATVPTQTAPAATPTVVAKQKANVEPVSV